MALIYWGQVNAASDITMSSIVDMTGTRTRQSIINLITPVAAGIIAGNPTVIAAAAAAAEAAVAQAILNENIVRAYPKTPSTRTGLSSVPMSWNWTVMDDTYSNTYGDTYEATFRDGGQRHGDVALVSAAGKIAASLVPDQFQTAAEVTQRIKNALDAYEPPEPDLPPEPSRPTSFWARVLKQRRLGQPSAAVLVGSSTSAANPGYATMFAERMRDEWYDGAGSVQYSPTADFTLDTSAGLHVYNAAQASTTATTYLEADKAAKLGALDPALVIHMVGSNDWAGARTPERYETDMRAALARCDAEFPGITQHVFVHSFPRPDVTAVGRYPWADFRAALHRIAADRTDAAVLDMSDAFDRVDVPGSDPLTLISGDGVHPSTDGHALISELLYRFFTT